MKATISPLGCTLFILVLSSCASADQPSSRSTDRNSTVTESGSGAHTGVSGTNAGGTKGGTVKNGTY